MNMQDFLGGPETRRSFLKRTVITAAAAAAVNPFKAPVYGQNQAPSAGRVIGANDRIAVAYVGTGSQGMAHVRSQKAQASAINIVQAAVCDVYQKHLKEAQRFIGLEDEHAYRDHRRLLERKDIDAIVVATVDVWHAAVAVDALEAGKHVYGEKPLARYLKEGFAIQDAVKRTGKVFQVGSQFCADPMFHKAAEWVRAGKLGPLVWGQGSYCRNGHPRSEWTYPVDPEANETNLDWKRWLGKTPQIPFDPNRYCSWHKYYAYNSGILGNLLPHKLLPLMLSTGSPEFPRRVVCSGTRKVSTDREITDTTHLLAEFPSGLTLAIAGSTVNDYGVEDVLRGLRATLFFSPNRNAVSLKPQRAFAGNTTPEEFDSPLGTADLGRLEKNFFDCIRSGATPWANIDLAIKAHTVLCLAEMSERMNLTLLFEPDGRKITTGQNREVAPLDYDSVVG